jgi:hypothetical protein
MTRRSITEAARKRQAEQTDPPEEEREDDTEDDERSAGNTDDPERRRFTQRMPEPLVDDIDAFADRHGMSRNAAINLLAKTGLERF